MANGFLLYYKRKFLLLATACGTVIGCNSISYSSTEHQFFEVKVEPILTTISILIAFAIAIYIILKQNPYRILRKKDFVFAEDVKKEIQEEFLKMKKFLVSGIALGLIIFGLSNSTISMNFFEGMNYVGLFLGSGVQQALFLIFYKSIGKNYIVSLNVSAGSIFLTIFLYGMCFVIALFRNKWKFN